MHRSILQRNAIKFYVKLNNFATKTLDRLQKFNGNHSLSKAQVFRRHKDFKDEESMLMTNNALGVHHVVDLKTMWVKLRRVWTLLIG